MKNLFKVLSLSLVIAFSSCNDNDEQIQIQANTIVDVAINNNLSSLVAALQRADLVGALSTSGNFTVLAPTNAAFSTFLQSKGFASVNDVPVNVLRNILLNHVITGELRSTDLSTGYAETNATSEASNSPMSIYINTNNGVRFNGVSSVVTPNVDASNGIVHVVDAVIDLPTVVTFATADTELSILVQALTRNDLQTNFVITLSTPGTTAAAPFTVFAPDNDAFASLLSELRLSNLAAIDEPTLRATLSKHVLVDMNVTSSMLVDDAIVPTFNGTSITIDLDGGAKIIDPRNRVSVIKTVDIQANNGIVHKIGNVILP